VTVSDRQRLRIEEDGRERRHRTTTLGEGRAISRGKLFDCNALGVEIKWGVGASGRAYHGEKTAADEDCG